MADVMLPAKPMLMTASPQPVIFGGWQDSSLGGASQWLERVGSRFSMVIETPKLKPGPISRQWIAMLLDGLVSGAIVGCRLPQLGFTVGTPGAIVVDGADQAGSVLNVRGGTPHYAVRRPQFFSIVHAGWRYLHYCTAQTILDADGKGGLPIAPMLRISPDDGDICEFVPIIEGKLGGDAKGWTMQKASVLGLSFTITEIK